MKTVLICLLLLSIVGCGGGNSNNSGGSSSSPSEDTISCSKGSYECKTKRDGTETSRYCVDGSHYEVEVCDDGCNEDTGRCYGDDGYSDGDTTCTIGDDSECDYVVCASKDTAWYEYNGRKYYCDGSGSNLDCSDAVLYLYEDCYNNTCSQGAFRCNGQLVQKCDQEEWKNYQQCNDDESCNAETGSCETNGGSGSIEPADNRYNSAYGWLSLQFSIDQIWNESDGQQSSVGSSQVAFATGTYGNGSTSVTPSDAYMIQTSAMYNASSGSVDIQQVPVYVQNDQGVGGNPLVILSIPEEYANVGALTTSLYQGAQATLYVVDVNWNTGYIDCFHAFGEGTVNITNIGNIYNHGAISLNGSVTLYSPKNYDGNGDISNAFDTPLNVCSPVY